MSPRTKKVLLVLLAITLFAGVSRVQQSLNLDRDELGLTRVQPLENAPPVLAFTTVALGGFRGLISNALWIRANDLQEEDKFFEMAQLAEWITALEPHFVQVWIVQAWNMAYNISVKFTDYADRWRWVERGIDLLRDEGLRYNPNETLLYRELAWFFQHKMGQALDDGNMYYKQQWANEMAEVFAKKEPNLDELIHPQTDDQKARARLLREKYKMDPEFMKEVNQRYGPLEWRLPESHAVYWAALGLKKAEENPSKIKADDLITLRRVIYQSMQMSFQRGRMIANPFIKAFEFGPNLDIIPKVSAAYEQAAQEDVSNHDHILIAHRNFLRDAIYFLYVHNRIAEAAYWYKYLAQKYPNKLLIESQTNSYPANLTLDEYAVNRVQEDVSESMSMDRIRAVIEGLVANAYTSTTVGEDERAAGFLLLADKVRTTYESKTSMRKDSIPMASLDDIKRDVVNRLLDPEEGAPPEVRRVLREKLHMPAEAPRSPAGTNAAPEKISGQ
ncbi:MAG TPA: hypothetical protein VL361_28670 [Candidatus Limnocylindrales bacterium]|nr:hypothetical protein [Candidatus Limnocylindrales bacterium]